MAMRSNLTSAAAMKPDVSVLMSRRRTPLPVLLYDLLKIRSPSRSEARIRALLMKEIEGIGGIKMEVDQKGNLWAWPGEKKVYPTVFSAHMDTVHRDEETQRLIITTDKAGVGMAGMVFAVKEDRVYSYTPVGGTKAMSDTEISQKVRADGGKFYRIEEVTDPELLKKWETRSLFSVQSLATKEQESSDKTVWGYFIRKEERVSHTPSVLGADDKLGCYALVELLRLRVPATYIFHVEEESGGGGSSWIRTNLADQLRGSKRAIAFDRAYYTDVIGSQRSAVCCSTPFGKALAGALNVHMPANNRYLEGAVGSFTDTANYTTIIPECTNISVGYFDQHTSNEHFDSVFFMDILVPALKKLQWDTLPTHRDPTSYRSYGSDNQYGYQGGYYGRTGNTEVFRNGKWISKEEAARLDAVDNDNTLDTDPNDNVSILPGAFKPTVHDVMDVKYYTERGLEAPWQISNKVSFEKIPEWNIANRLYQGKPSQTQMQIVLGKWLMTQDDYTDITKVMYVIMTSEARIKAELEVSQKLEASQKVRITELEGQVTKLMEELRHAKEDLGFEKPAAKEPSSPLSLPAPKDQKNG